MTESIAVNMNPIGFNLRACFNGPNSFAIGPAILPIPPNTSPTPLNREIIGPVMVVISPFTLSNPGKIVAACPSPAVSSSMKLTILPNGFAGSFIKFTKPVANFPSLSRIPNPFPDIAFAISVIP